MPEVTPERPTDILERTQAAAAQNPMQMAALVQGPAGLVAMLDTYAPFIEMFKAGAPPDVVHHLEGLANAVRDWAARGN
jgi:hypothetical protein